MATGIPDHPSVSCFPIHCAQEPAPLVLVQVKLLDRYSFDLLAVERAQKALGSRGKSRVPSKQARNSLAVRDLIHRFEFMRLRSRRGT